MPRFEQYPPAESLPEDAILLFADPNDLVDGNPKVKRFPASFLPQQIGQSPTVHNVTPEAFGTTTLPSGLKSGDIINLDGPASSAILGITFQGGAAGAPPEGTILFFRNEKAGTAVTVQHNVNNRVLLIEGQDVVLEGNRNAFLTFYVRRFDTPILFQIRQVGGGFY